MLDIEKILEEDAKLTEAALTKLYDKKDSGVFVTDVLKKAELYSLLSGGKRIRPAIVIEICKALGGRVEAALPFACAIEMIHTSSLIHDDLPCMDNAEMRRGKPTSHKTFGEANAVLAGDGLLIDAFAVCADNKYLPPERCAEAVMALSNAAGSYGMVLGQSYDLYGEGQKLNKEQFFGMISGKTGALIRCAGTLGALAANKPADDEITNIMSSVYCNSIGSVFQIIDDVLDVTSTKERMGKDINHDAEADKTTTLSFMTVDEALDTASELTRSAVDCLKQIGVQSEVLVGLANFLLKRTH